MSAEESFKAGRLEESLATLQQDIRRNPADARLRHFLFSLLSVLGQWERALTQLDVIESLGAQAPEAQMTSRLYRSVVQSEKLRADVFAGKSLPTVFGEPEEWMGLLVQAGQHSARHETKAAQELTARALELAVAVPGEVDGIPFEWLADADQRLGPMLEVFLEGRYFWVPFSRIRRVAFNKPADIIDLLWLPTKFVWVNGGEASGFVPVRYPGSEGSGDPLIRMSRKTEWSQANGDVSRGQGQRLFATDQKDYALLECGRIDFTAQGEPNSK